MSIFQSHFIAPLVLFLVFVALLAVFSLHLVFSGIPLVAAFFLGMYQIDVKIMGEEYRDKDFTGKDLCRQRDIEFYFNKRDHRFSTSDLRKRVYNAEDL